jgi:hypothetical protein
VGRCHAGAYVAGHLVENVVLVEVNAVSALDTNHNAQCLNYFRAFGYHSWTDGGFELDAKPLSIGKILSERQRFVVPVYQRTYAWNKRELEPLFDQIEAKSDELLATGKVAFSHYMGALLLIPDADPVFGRILAFNVVDGQQRLTTFHLCFAALRDVATDYAFGDLARQLSNLVLHSDDTPMRDPASERYKLEPTAYDRAMFRDLVNLDRRAIAKKFPDAFYKNGKIQPTAPEPLWAYWYFWTEAEQYITEGQMLPKRADYDQEPGTLGFPVFRGTNVGRLTASICRKQTYR